ncbi:hypothetical protein VP01_1696g3 [Puccinia sorghi]|uniref:Reverse transcriptase Ty1/copia-type domain-containing protein n=1 Tax=Puccinia sorghi TaxID=27349 RepID=A0A0L6VFU1_9BASI|nr:hypothetical protein VP01_1696g3 [Puccinia sorghi]
MAMRSTPEGCKRRAPFLKLKKSFYGLKQAPKNWYDTLTSWFNKINFYQSIVDPCLFIQKDKKSFIFLHVDDLVVIGDFKSFEEDFLLRFPNSLAHDPDTLLGMELDLLVSSIAILSTLPCLILNYLACQTHPDLAPAVLILSSFNNTPGINHWRQT